MMEFMLVNLLMRHRHARGVRKAEKRDGRPIGRVKRRSELFKHAGSITVNLAFRCMSGLGQKRPLSK